MMKRLLLPLILALMLGIPAFAADAANDIILSQRKPDNSGNIQRNVPATGAITSGSLPSFHAAVGLASSTTDNAIIRADGTGGNTQNSAVTIADTTGAIAGANSLTSQALSPLVLATGTSGTAVSIASATNIATLSAAPSAPSYTSTVATGTAPLVVASTTLVANLHAATADTSTTTTNATNIGITDDTTTNATMYPTWVTANTGNLPVKVSSTKMTFNPSTGALTGTTFNLGTTTPGIISGTSGAITLTGAGTNQNITLTPSGTGVVLTPATIATRLQANWMSLRTTGDVEAASLYLAGGTIAVLTGASTVVPVGLRSSITGAGNCIQLFAAGAQTNTSAASNFVSIVPIYNQASGTASNTDLLINRTQTAVGSGAQRLIDAQVGGTSMFSVVNNGHILAGGLTTDGGGNKVLQLPGLTGVLNIGATANATIGVTADTTAGILTFTAPSAGSYNFAAGAITAAGTISTTHSTAGDVALGASNSSATGFGAYLRGGSTQASGRYIAQFISGDAVNNLLIYSDTIAFTGMAATVATAVNTGVFKGVGFGFSNTSNGASFLGGNLTIGGDFVLGASTSAITGGAGNMTITSGTGNSRTMTLRTTTSGGTATNAIVIGDTQAVTSYKNIATEGDGLVAIRKVGRITAQTTAATICAYTLPATDGSFEVSGNILINSAVAVSTSLNVDYTDEGNTARTMILPITGLAGTFASGGLAIAAQPYESAVIHIRCKASTSITISVAAGTFTTVNYNADGVIKQTK